MFYSPEWCVLVNVPCELKKNVCLLWLDKVVYR